MSTEIKPIYTSSLEGGDIFRLLNLVHSMAGEMAVAKIGGWQLAETCSQPAYALTTWTNGIVDVTAETYKDSDKERHYYRMTACADLCPDCGERGEE